MGTPPEPSLQWHCLPGEGGRLPAMPWRRWLLWVPPACLAQLGLCLAQCWVTTSLSLELPHVGAQPGVVGLVQVQG